MPTINLSRPLPTHKGEVKQLTLREPTARDFMDINKLPVRFRIDAVTASREVYVDYDTLFQWTAKLSDVGVDILATLGKRDVQRVVEVMTELLGDEAETTAGDVAKN